MLQEINQQIPAVAVLYKAQEGDRAESGEQEGGQQNTQNRDSFIQPTQNQTTEQQFFQDGDENHHAYKGQHETIGTPLLQKRQPMVIEHGTPLAVCEIGEIKQQKDIVNIIQKRGKKNGNIQRQIFKRFNNT